ncbi:unnamed protein product [Rotaria sp. Silwood2]|nr:unnamed protein product [Rotaria sp. Silwood2]
MYPQITKFFKKETNLIQNDEQQEKHKSKLQLSVSHEIQHSLPFQSNLDPSSEQVQLIPSSSSTSSSSLQVNLSSNNAVTSTASLSSTSDISIEDVQRISSSSTSPSSLEINSSLSHAATSKAFVSSANDIGLYIGKTLSGEQKYQLITHHFQPDKTFVWPYKERTTVINGKTLIEKRYLKQNHLDEFKWLRYSSSQKGLYCIACAIFTTSTTRISSYGRLVEKPLDDYKYLLGNTGDLSLHKRKNYHSDSIAKMENFLYIYSKKPEMSVRLLIDKRSQNKIAENRARLKPIIETILLCGKQNFPLRGHRDDGGLSTENEGLLADEGNFRALLQYRIESGDVELKQHIETCRKNATYISKTIQNELISIIGNLILKEIIQEVKAARFFTILLDETADVANIEQASLCIRYVLHDQIHEKFLMFIPVKDRSGAGLANLIIKSVLGLGLDLANCIGQGYDGCSSMAGYIKGCQALIREKYPHILYVHCVSHSFNLALSDSCDIRSIQNMIGTIKEVYNFIRSSSVRSQLFVELARPSNETRSIAVNNILKSSSNQSSEDKTTEVTFKKVKLANVCPTRWVERHVAVETFNTLYPVVVELLIDLMQSKDRECSTKSNLFYKAISSSEFLCSLTILNKLLSFTINISRSLQNSQIDLMTCISNIEDILQVLQKIRNEPDVEYKFLFEEAQDLANHTESTIEMPRIIQRQINRNNIPASSTYEYFKLNIFIPVLDHFLMAIKDRFTEHVQQAARISSIIPQYIADKTYDDLAPAIELYQKFLPGSITEIKSEFLLWKKRWTQINTENSPNVLSPTSMNNIASVTMKRKEQISLSDTAIDAYVQCTEAFYPNIKVLLQIFSTLPVTTASTERTFSVLKLLKTYLRSTMSQTRLNGLAMMYIYRNLTVNVDSVINNFAKSNRRLLL